MDITAKILYQDFSKQFYNSAAIKTELEEVQKIVVAQPPDPVLALSDFHDTNVGSDLLSAMNSAPAATKAHIQKIAILGVRNAAQIGRPSHGTYKSAAQVF